MNRRTIATLIAGVIFLMAILLIVGSIESKLPDRIHTGARDALKQYDAARAEMTQTGDEIKQAIKGQPALFQALGYDTVWPQQVSTLEKRIEGLGATRQLLESLLEKNDGDTYRQVIQYIRDLSKSTTAIKEQMQGLKKERQDVLDFKAKLPEHLQQMQREHAAIQSQDLTRVKSLVQKAGLDWPGKKADLDQRLGMMQEAIADADRVWQSTQQARQALADGDVTDELVAAVYKAHRQLQACREILDTGHKTIPELIEQLNWSWDKLLVDMEIQEGQEVKFYQEFETVKTYALAGEGEKTQQQTNRARMAVAKTVYESMKNNLGMVVEHKPAGMYDHEATRTIQPPGYAYVASPQQGRNRYGYWDHRPGGGSFWVFYGQYALMRDLFWGSGYRPISATDYGYYDQARRSRQAYYGRDDRGRPMYGSSGSVTQTKYKNSKYVRTGGYRSSRYVQSGGTYRGSRYESRSYRSSSRSGSRFGGGK